MPGGALPEPGSGSVGREGERGQWWEWGRDRHIPPPPKSRHRVLWVGAPAPQKWLWLPPGTPMLGGAHWDSGWGHTGTWWDTHIQGPPRLAPLPGTPRQHPESGRPPCRKAQLEGGGAGRGERGWGAPAGPPAGHSGTRGSLGQGGSRVSHHPWGTPGPSKASRVSSGPRGLQGVTGFKSSSKRNIMVALGPRGSPWSSFSIQEFLHGLTWLERLQVTPLVQRASRPSSSQETLHGLSPWRTPWASLAKGETGFPLIMKVIHRSPLLWEGFHGLLP